MQKLLLGRLFRGCQRLTDFRSVVPALIMSDVCDDLPSLHPTVLALECYNRFFRWSVIRDILHLRKCPSPELTLCKLLLRVGHSLKDLSLYDPRVLTHEMFEAIPNITAFRCYYSMGTLGPYIPHPDCCKSLVTLEFIGLCATPGSIIGTLSRWGHPSLRALCMYNTWRTETDPYFLWNVERVARLGMCCDWNVRGIRKKD